MGRIENGKLVLEVVKCWHCEGTGKYEYGVLCPNWGKSQRGKACEHCGSKSKNNHKTIGTEVRDCDICSGTGKIQENSCSTSTFNPFEVIPMRCVMVDRGANFNEAYLGLGSFFCCTDYGRSNSVSDFDLIAKIRSEHKDAQYCKFSKGDRVADEIIVVRRNDGYSVVAHYKA